MSAIARYLSLPPEVSAFEARYLARTNRVAFVFLAAHLPAFVLLAAVNGTGPLSAALMTLAVLAGPAVAVRSCSLRLTSVVMGVAAMFLGGILVHIGQGPVQIEMHFYFFVLIALLAVFANPAVILAAAATVTAHHAILWLVVPTSVFNYDAEWWVVGVHAAFVVLESVAACYMARSFFDNVVGLERIVAARTAEVAARNQDMQMLLDAVGQGFLTVRRDGTLNEERSAAVDRLFGTPVEVTLPDFLRPHDPKVADWLALGLDEVFADVLPVEVTLDQLPKRMECGARTLKLEYAPIPREGRVEALAVVLTDITAAVAREQLEAEHRELIAMADRIARDRSGFLEFIQEAEQLMTRLWSDSTDDLAVIKRQVHTLKGNAAIFGLESVAAACHQIEDHIADTGTLPDVQAWDVLDERWRLVRANLKRLVGDQQAGVTLNDREYAEVLLAVLNDAPRDELARRVAAWRLEPTETRLGRVAEQARQLAGRLGKGAIQVRQSGGHLRTDAEHWAFFWSAFVHVVRNAVDHGLESPAARAAAGKPPAGVLDLATRIDGDEFVVSLSDDGRGIDWPRVAAAAAARGLPTGNHRDLVEALFHDGLTTAAEVSSVSGRGIGMGAVRAACRDLGGHIHVRSNRGAGTTFEFRFPVSAMAPATFDLLDRHGVPHPEESFFVNSVPSERSHRSDEPLATDHGVPV